MAQYIKDGVVYTNLTSILLNGMRIINPKVEQIIAAGYEEYIPAETPIEVTLEDTIQSKLSEITEYDLSDNVNIFYYNNIACWLDKQTRVGLMNSTTIEKEAGRTTTKLILDDISVELPVDNVLGMLAQLELYAKDCYDVTAQHKLNVKALTSIEEVNAYDYTTGYPDKIDFGYYNESNDNSDME